MFARMNLCCQLRFKQLFITFTARVLKGRKRNEVIFGIS